MCWHTPPSSSLPPSEPPPPSMQWHTIMVIFECIIYILHWHRAYWNQYASSPLAFFKSHEMEMYFSNYNSMNASFCHTRAVLIHCIVGFIFFHLSDCFFLYNLASSTTMTNERTKTITTTICAIIKTKKKKKNERTSAVLMMTWTL